MTWNARDSKTLFWWIFPYVVFISVLVVYPVGLTFFLSLTRDHSWSGLSNFQEVFFDAKFSKILFNTLVWVGSVLVFIVVNISLAILLNQGLRGQNVFRTIILVLPWATPDVVAAVNWRWIFNAMYGVLNDILMRLGVIEFNVPWLGNQSMALMSVIVANIWKGFSVGTMIMLAAFQGIPSEIYEAAKIDGSYGFKTLFRITLPLVRPTLLSLILVSIIWTINYFPLIHIMTGGGPAHGTDILVTWAYREFFSFLKFGKGSAIAVLLFLTTFSLSCFYAKVIFAES